MSFNQFNLLGLTGKMGSGKDTAARIIQYLTQKNQKISLEKILNYSPLQQPITTEWEIKKFAGKLKECVSLITGISLEDLEKHSVKQQNLGPEWNKLMRNPFTSEITDITLNVPMTVREMLQQFGTQGGRAIHPNFWVNALFADYKPKLTQRSKNKLLGYLINSKKYKNSIVEYKNPKWIISDVRFINEINAIEKHGGIIIKIFRNDNCENSINNEKQHISETELDNYQFKYEIDNNYDIVTLTNNIKALLENLKII